MIFVDILFLAGIELISPVHNNRQIHRCKNQYTVKPAAGAVLPDFTVGNLKPPH
jgi:hypothetical protein